MSNLVIFFNNNSNTVIHSVNESQEINNLLKLAADSANKPTSEIIGHSFIGTEELNKLYRPALVYKNNRIYTDKQKIIEDKLDSIRVIRNNLLKDIDIKRRIAEDTQNKTEIELYKKQAHLLRDLPKLIKWEKLKTDKEILEYNPFEDKEIFT